MSWLVFAFSGPVLWAISTHLDKYLLERYFKHSSVAVLLVFTALFGLVLLPFIWFYEPRVLTLPLRSILLMTLSGVLYLSALYFYLGALQSEEASVVAPFYQAAPLFAYVFGYVVLGETMSASQIVGGALIVGATLLLSIERRSEGKFKLRLVALMLTCALLIAVSSLIFKLFAVRDDYWSTTFWSCVGQALFGVAVLAVAKYRTQFFSLLRANTGAVLMVNSANELINLGGGLGTRYALVLAPLGLVQAVASTTTLFVFLFGIGTSLFLPALARENLSAPNLARKGASAVLVAIGVVLVGR